jgi:protein-disulfide isomerase
MAMKRYLPLSIVLGVALVAVAAGIKVYQTRLNQADKAVPTALVPAQVISAERSLHVRGPAAAPVTVEEFADFECPPCGALFGVVKQLQSESDPRVRIIFRHHPLRMHPHALAAALASEAAGLQGHFWEMHDLLYHEQQIWSTANDTQAVFDDYAKKLGLDVPRFHKDCESMEAKAQITVDQKRAAERGVTSTPTVFINDWVVPRSSYSVAGLKNRIAMMAANISKLESSSPAGVRADTPPLKNSQDNRK